MSTRMQAISTLVLATRLTPHWESHGQFLAGRETLESALAESDDPAPDRAAAHRAIATLAMAQGDLLAARGHLEAAIAIHEATGDERSAASATGVLAIALLHAGDLGSAERVGRSALEGSGRLGDNRERGFALTALGLVAAADGRPDDAFNRLLEALQIFRGDGARNEAASVLTNLGNVAHDSGDDHRAVRFYDGARQLFDALGDRRGAAMCLNNLALLAAAHSDLDHAIELGRRAHDHFSAVGDVHGEAAMLNNLAGWWGTHDASEATALYEQAIARFEKLGDTAGSGHCTSKPQRSAGAAERSLQARGPSCGASGIRPFQSRDRRATLHLRTHSAQPSVSHLHQTRSHVAHTTRDVGGPAGVVGGRCSGRQIERFSHSRVRDTGLIIEVRHVLSGRCLEQAHAMRLAGHKCASDVANIAPIALVLAGGLDRLGLCLPERVERDARKIPINHEYGHL